MRYRNARYIDATRIDCEIKHPAHGWIPYTLDPSDTDMTVNNNDLLAVMTQNGDVAAYVPPTQEELDAHGAATVRLERDNRLARDVDPIASNALRWAALTDQQRQAWGDYRQALLDITKQSGFPHNVTWPAKPE